MIFAINEGKTRVRHPKAGFALFFSRRAVLILSEKSTKITQHFVERTHMGEDGNDTGVF